jgi:hypothetical protein
LFARGRRSAKAGSCRGWGATHSGAKLVNSKGVDNRTAKERTDIPDITKIQIITVLFLNKSVF